MNPCPGLSAALVAACLFLALPAFGAAPGNDSVSSPTVVQGFSGVTAGSNVDATIESFEDPAAGQASSWFMWVSENSQTVTFSTLGSDFATTLAVYEGVPPAPGSGLATPTYTGVPVAAAATLPAPYNGARQVTFSGSIGKPYYLVVNGAVAPALPQHTAQGRILLSWLQAFDTPPVAPVPGWVGAGPGSVQAAQGQANVQVPVFRVLGSAGQINTTVYFRDISTNSYLGPPVPVHFDDGQVMAYASFNTWSNAGPAPDQAVGLELSAQTQAFNFGSYPYADPAVVVLNTSHPVNDAFANALPLTGSSGSQAFSNQGGSGEPGEPVYKYGISHSLWYTWTAPQDGVVAFSGSSTSPGTNAVGPAALYTGTSLATLVPVPGGLTRLNGGAVHGFREGFWPVTAGTTYQLMVDAADGSSTTPAATLGWSMTTTGAFQFAQSAYTAFETVGEATLTVTRPAASIGAVTLAYSFQDGSAVAGTDYDGTPGTLTFANGELSQDLTVPLILHPGQTLPTRFFKVILAPGPGSPLAGLGNPGTAAVSITNNDNLGDAYVLPLTSISLGGNIISSGTVHGSLAGATLEHNELSPGPSGQPAGTASVWYKSPAFQNAVSFTCSQAFITVGQTLGLSTNAATFHPEFTAFYDPSVAAWRCTANGTSSLPLLVRVSNPGTSPGPFDLHWEAASTLIPPFGPIYAAGGHVLQLPFKRSGNLSSPATLTVTPMSGTAVAGVDFDATVQTLTFYPGETTKVINITTYAETNHVVPLTFTAQVACTQGNIILVSPYLATLSFSFYGLQSSLPLAGSFQSLLTFPGDPAHPGYVTATLSLSTAHGITTTRVTGKLTYHGKTYSFAAPFDVRGSGSVHSMATYHFPGTTLTLTLISANSGESLEFQLVDGTTTSDPGVGDMQGFNARTQPCLNAGAYTALLGVQGPAGDCLGVATAKVSTAGALTMAGVLADGRAFTLSTALHLAPHALSTRPHALVYLPLPPGDSLTGDLQFVFTPAAGSSFTASLEWTTPFTDSGLSTTPAEAGGSYPFFGQLYVPPKAGARAFGLPGDGAFTLGFSPGLFAGTTHTAYWGTNNRINTLQFDDPRLSLTVNTATGLLTGSAVWIASHPVPLPLRAVLLQATHSLQGLPLAPRSTYGFPPLQGFGQIEGH